MVDYKVTENIAIAAITLYRPGTPGYEVRPELALDFLERAIDLGYKPVVVDGGSDDGFLAELDKINGLDFYVEPQEVRHKSGPNRRSAIKKAYDTGRKVITLTELEKTGFLDNISSTAEIILDNRADIVIPGRTSLESYPLIQRIFECMVNRTWKKCTGTSADICFGPRVFERETSSYFTEYDGRYGDMWESSFIPVFDYILGNLKKIRSGGNSGIKEMDFAYEHPKEQTLYEQRNLKVFLRKWLRQYRNIRSSLKKHRKSNLSKLLEKD